MDDPYYRAQLARIHHLGFGFHAEAVAPAIIELLEPVGRRGGLVLELGCGSGLLTRRLVDAGLQVLATDASPAMLDLAAEHAPGAVDIVRLTLPVDPIPEADAVVSVGHPLNYLATADDIDVSIAAMADALRPGGVIAFDICDLEWGRVRAEPTTATWIEDDWVLVNRSSLPAPDTYVRDMTMFVRRPDGTWQRDDEVHHNVLVDTGPIPDLLASHGIDATVADAFGDERLPVGLRAVTGHRRP